MRLGEIKQILDNVVDDNGSIIIDNEPIYGGQAFEIKNYINIVSALEIIIDQEWNNTDSTSIREIIKNHPPKRNIKRLNQEEFEKINSYILSINQQLPYYCSILDSIVEKQEEMIINIKLPSQINSLTELNTVNKRLDKILKIFALDGQFELKGFDKGSEWYEILATGQLSYLCIINGLEIAKKYFETKKAYFKSKKAELDYKATFEKTEDFKEDKFCEYCERRLQLEVEEQVKIALEKVGNTNGKTEQQFQTDMIKGVKELVKELDEGTEFHLSLNPPEYIQGNIGGLNIDYKKIRNIREEENKKLEVGKQKELSEPNIEEKINKESTQE